MKERPILFSAPMVRAILDGTKTQTRRVAKKPVRHPDLGNLYAPGALVLEKEPQHVIERSSPFGQPGDRLWLREAWIPDPPCDGTWNYTEWAGCRIGKIASVPDQFRKPEFCNYRATWPHKEDGMLWTPGIHMPRWASRIDLLIKSVRVERLQDISEADATAEGCTKNHNGYYWGGPHAVSGLKQMGTAHSAYRDLWQYINGPGSWEANPWVWAIEFERVGK